tara:strand:- start:1931 stop:4516 length:2586 start_codon:yes stop_codon:yes gene_type:complete
MAYVQLNLKKIGLIDLGDSGESPLRVNKSLSDISLIRKRSDVTAYKFPIPDINENTKKLDFQYLYGHHNHKKVDAVEECELIIDGKISETGFARIVSSKTNDNKRTYEASFTGGNINWWAEMDDYTVSDLEYSTHTGVIRTEAGVSSTWTNTVDNGDDFVFSLIDRGRYANSTPYIADTRSFYPDLFLTPFVRKIFKKLGYDVDSAFLDDADVKKLIMSYFNDVFTWNKTTMDAHLVKGVTSISLDRNMWNVPVSNLDSSGFPTPSPIAPYRALWNYPNLWADVLDAQNEFDTNGTLSPTIPLTYKAKLNMKITSDRSTPPPVYIRPVIQVQGSGISSGTYRGGAFKYEVPEVGGTVWLEHEIDFPIFDHTTQTAVIGFEAWRDVVDANYQSDIVVRLNVGSTVEFNVEEGLGIYGPQSFNLQDILDDETSLKKIFNDIVKMFNLYAETDGVLKRVRLEPRKDFYKGIETAEDWSKRIDRSREMKTVKNSVHYSQFLKMKYAEDSIDSYVNKQADYMAYTHDLGSNFSDGTTTHQLGYFGATWAGLYWDSSVDFNDPTIPPVTARLWSDVGETSPPHSLGYSARILNYVYAVQPSFNYDYGQRRGGILESIYSSGTLMDVIPAALPFTTSQGYVAPINLSFDGVDGLFSEYYGQFTRIIIDGHTLECYAYFDDDLYTNANWRTPKWIKDEEGEEIEGYYILESIKGYDPATAGFYKIKLLKVLPQEPLKGVPQGGGGGGSNSQSGLRSASSSPQGGGKISISSSRNIESRRNIVNDGSIAAGEGLLSTGTTPQIVTGAYNENVAGARSVSGNGSAGNRRNSSIVTADGETIKNPTILQQDGEDIYYHTDERGNNFYIYKET